MLGLYETWLALRSSLMVSAGMDLEKPRPLHVLVGVRTSVTTGFFSMAAWIQTKVMGGQVTLWWTYWRLRGSSPLVANSFFCS